MASRVLSHIPVSIQPVYEDDRGVRQKTEAVTLRVPCVHGEVDDGFYLASLPTFDETLYCQDEGAISTSVAQAVRHRLEDCTPREVSRFLPPPVVALDYLYVKVKETRRHAAHKLELPNIQTVAEPVDDMRGQLTRAWGRAELIQQLAHRVDGDKANVLLVGETGSGKTAVLVDAVRKLERESRGSGGGYARVPHRFFTTNGARLIAGMRYLGQWEQRCEDVISELAAIGGVLCVDNILDLLRLGGQGPIGSLAAFFTPYLQEGELQLIAEATPAELMACRRLLPSFVDAFTVLELPAMDRRGAISAIQSAADALAEQQRVKVGDGVVNQVYTLFKRFEPYHAFPGEASRFTGQLVDVTARKRESEVTTDLVIDRFIDRTGLPEVFLLDDMTLQIDDVEREFRQQVIGQDAACRAAAELVTTFKAGLNDPSRPVGVMLFAGPTGVGKTQLAKTLAAYFFGHGNQTDNLIRLDMSEYAGPDAAWRLLGPPDGEPGALIKRVRARPFALVLLDEIEKAAPEIFDILLGVFDEGRLTDRFGRTTTFRSTVIVMTSNLGAGKDTPFGFAAAPAHAHLLEVQAFFRPELFNRIDAVVSFDRLSADAILAIAEKELRAVATREGLKAANITLTWSKEVARCVANAGYDDRYGARPLLRALEDRVVTPLARYLIANPTARNVTLHLTLGEDRTIRIEPKAK